MTFDLAVVTLTFKILSGLYVRNRKVWEGTVVGGVGRQGKFLFLKRYNLDLYKADNALKVS